jgi:hypothetical protein
MLVILFGIVSSFGIVALFGLIGGLCAGSSAAIFYALRPLGAAAVNRQPGGQRSSQQGAWHQPVSQQRPLQRRSLYRELWPRRVATHAA